MTSRGAPCSTSAALSDGTAAHPGTEIMSTLRCFPPNKQLPALPRQTPARNPRHGCGRFTRSIRLHRRTFPDCLRVRASDYRTGRNGGDRHGSVTRSTEQNPARFSNAVVSRIFRIRSSKKQASTQPRARPPCSLCLGAHCPQIRRGWEVPSLTQASHWNVLPAQRYT